MVLDTDGETVLNLDAIFAASHDEAVSRWPWRDLAQHAAGDRHKQEEREKRQQRRRLREGESYRMTLLGASRHRLEAFATSINFSSELNAELIRERCDDLYKGGEMSDFMARVHTPAQVLAVTLKKKKKKSMENSNNERGASGGGTLRGAGGANRVTTKEDRHKDAAEEKAAREEQRLLAEAAGKYEMLNTAPVQEILARNAARTKASTSSSPSSSPSGSSKLSFSHGVGGGGRSPGDGSLSKPLDDEDFRAAAGSVAEAALLQCHIFPRLTGRRQSTIINPMISEQQQQQQQQQRQQYQRRHLRNNKTLLLYKKRAKDSGDWILPPPSHCLRGCPVRTEVAFFLISETGGGDDPSSSSSKHSWWLDPSAWRLAKVVVAKNETGLPSTSGSGDGEADEETGFFTAATTTARRVFRYPRWALGTTNLAVAVEYLPLEQLYDLTGSSLNDYNDSLFSPFDFLRAPFYKPTPRRREISHTEHENEKLFLPLGEAEYMELFRRLVESTPFKTLDEAQGCGFDVRALHEASDRDSRQCEAVFFLHKQNAARAAVDAINLVPSSSSFFCSSSPSGGGASGGGPGAGGGSDGSSDGRSCLGTLSFLWQWAMRLRSFKWEEIEAIKVYFGEEMGFYFLFTGHYCSWLWPGAIFGVLCWVAVSSLKYGPFSSLDAAIVKSTFHMGLAM